MQSLVALLAVLIGVAVAHPMVLSPDDIKEQNKDISSKEYLKKIFEQDLVSYDADRDVHYDLVKLMVDLKLSKALDTLEEINSWKLFRDAKFDKITVFLPTDEAMERWDDELPQRLDSRELKQLVKAWIIPKKIKASDVTNDLLVKSHNGAMLRFNKYRDELQKEMITVNGAKIVKADQMHDIESPVVVHIVDKVIYPLPIGDVIETLDDNKAFSVIVDLLKRTDLAKSLKSEKPVTVLVPTDVAFQALPQGALDDLKNDPAKLEKVLKYHVINDVRYSASLSSGKDLVASQEDRISVDIEDDKIVLNKEKKDSKAKVIKADIPTTNGVIHVIDHVLIPPEKHFVLV